MANQTKTTPECPLCGGINGHTNYCPSPPKSATIQLDEEAGPMTKKMWETKTTKYRKKPIVVEAIQFTKEMYDLGGHVSNVVKGIVCNSVTYGDGIDKPPTAYGFIIQTLEGAMLLRVGDWIITGVRGEKYPCKPDIFEATYERV